MSEHADTAPIADQQDWSALEEWLRREVPDLDGEMAVRQFTGVGDSTDERLDQLGEHVDPIVELAAARIPS